MSILCELRENFCAAEACLDRLVLNHLTWCADDRVQLSVSLTSHIQPKVPFVFLNLGSLLPRLISSYALVFDLNRRHLLSAVPLLLTPFSLLLFLLFLIFLNFSFFTYCALLSTIFVLFFLYFVLFFFRIVITAGYRDILGED